MPQRAPWSNRGDPEAGDSGDEPHTLEYLKVLSLMIVVFICAASWSYDPFEPTNTGGGGYLALPLDFGVNGNLRARCRPLDKEVGNCRKQQQQLKDTSVPDEAAGWLQRVSDMARERDKASSDPCASEKSAADACNQAARATKEMVQLRCSNEGMRYWECTNSGAGANAEAKPSCGTERAAMEACSSRVANDKMLAFGS